MSLNSDVRFYKTRDSATSMLRKMGIKSRDYNSFIDISDDNTYICQVAKAEMYLASSKNPIMAEVGNPAPEVGQATEAKRVVRRTVQAEEPKAKRGSVSTTIRELILAGKSNQEIWATLKETFDLDDSKKHYPSWYRCEMRRKGMVK